ncbi:MAG: NADH-quinone oxidoreductase subunit K [Actinobacteria bacterium]|nr:NADH-quinone oxidoreductase subunit K [Actinomycetota bacterium]
MTVVLAVVAAVLTGCGVYLVTAGRLSRVVIGVGLLGHASNLVIFGSAAQVGGPAFAGDEGPFADPLPQAMALTAIVITLGVVALLLAIAYRSWSLDGDDPVEGVDVVGGAEVEG